MAEILRCADRWGRDIVLYEDTWYDKIVAKHVEMNRQLDALMSAVMEPDRVNFDAIFRNGENYYRLAVLDPPYHRVYLKVVVRFDSLETSVGKVITAYPSPQYVARGERYKWHK